LEKCVSRRERLPIKITNLDGVIDLDINLAGQGKSVAALMAGLNGDVVAIPSEGQMPVKYLNLVGDDITTSLLKIVNPLEKKKEGWGTKIKNLFSKPKE
jgi:hypothetical protein